jgi:peptidoglycan/LPS O-acetylase OafA/YrhL
VTSNFWIPPVTAGMVVQVLLYPFSPRWNGPNFAPLIFLAVLGFGAYSAIGRVRRKEEDSFLAASALAVYALTFACAIVLSVAVKPIFYDRYLVSVAGVLVLAFASFVRTIKATLLAIALALYR